MAENPLKRLSELVAQRAQSGVEFEEHKKEQKRNFKRAMPPTYY
jgi:hypothetical protein